MNGTFLTRAYASARAVVGQLQDLCSRLAQCHDLLYELRTSAPALDPRIRRGRMLQIIRGYEDVVLRSEDLISGLSATWRDMQAGMAELQVLRSAGLPVDEPVRIGCACVEGIRWTEASALRVGVSARSGVAALQSELAELDLEVASHEITASLLSRVGTRGNRKG